MATSRNPFELLQEDFPVTAAAPVVATPKTVPKPQQVEQKKPKPIQKNTKKPEIKGSFEEEPVHATKPAKPVQEATEQREKKRQFDRKSNDKKLTQKKSTGKGSWGQEVDGQTFEPLTAEEEEEQEKLRQEAELEQSYKSLEDYQKEKASKKEVNVRAPNEGVDDKQWKKMTKLVKVDDVEELFAGKVKEKERKVKEKPVKNVLVIEQTFAPAPREKTERFGRGAAGKGPGSGSDRASGKGKGKPKDAAPGGGRGQAKGKAVNVMDPNAFPSLVAN